MVPSCRIHVTRASSDAMRASSYFITRKGAHVKLPIELHVGEGKVEKGGDPASQSENNAKRIEACAMGPRLG